MRTSISELLSGEWESGRESDGTVLAYADTVRQVVNRVETWVEVPAVCAGEWGAQGRVGAGVERILLSSERECGAYQCMCVSGTGSDTAWCSCTG
jgi:hypothetical protein